MDAPLPDAALVAAMASKDPAGLDGAYRRYADALFTYVRSLVGDRHAAADIVHDTFLLANQHVDQLRDPSRLRQWLYAIARNEGLRQVRRQARHTPLEGAPDIAAETVDMSAAVRSAEIAEVVRAAMGGLSDGDREVAELAVRHQMSAADIASVLDVPVNHAHARLSRAREQLIISLGSLLVARQQGNRCRQLAGILRGWDGRLTPLLRKRLHRHIDICKLCTEVRRQRMNPAALLNAYAGLPFAAVPDLRRTAGDVPSTPKWRPDSGFPWQPDPASRPPSIPALVMGIVAVIALIGGSAVLLNLEPTLQRDPGINPTATLPGLSPSAGVLTPIVTVEPPKPPTTGVAALDFQASATATCVSGATYSLTVVVTANANLATSTLTRQGSPPESMSVSGKKAQITVTAVQSAPFIVWRVGIRAQDGRTLQGQNQNTSHPCF